MILLTTNRPQDSTKVSSHTHTRTTSLRDSGAWKIVRTDHLHVTSCDGVSRV
jgi:hypothetical protein